MLPPSPVIANGQHSSAPVTSIVMGSVAPSKRQNGSKSPLSNCTGLSGNECSQGTPPGPGSPQGSSGVDSPRTTSAFSSPQGTPPLTGTPPRGTPPMSPSLKFSLASLSLNSEGLSSKEILKAGIKRKRELQSLVEISPLPDMKEEDEEIDEEIAKITGSGEVLMWIYTFASCEL